MLNRENTLRGIQERMGTLGSSDVCALFLLSIETNAQNQEALNLDAAAERTASLLARFFRITDIVGYLGENRFAAFLTGKLTGSVIWEKAATLSEALWLTAENAPAETLTSYVGVYVFRAYDDTAEAIFRKAEYALEMARKDANRHFYIYTMAGTDVEYFRHSHDSFSAHMLLNYIDEGVRLLEVKDGLKAVYVSPGYYRRLGLPAETAAPQQIKIHPADREAYEQDVLEVSHSGGQKESRYRISRDGLTWISCRLRLLRISASEAGSVVLEISHNIAGLVRLKSQYDEKREWLHFLADETDYQLWEADMKTRTFRLLYTKNILDGRQTVYANFPESLIEAGRIHRDSADRFRAFAAEMLSGKADGSANFMIQYRQTSCYGWASMSYHMLYDEEGRPEKAIGIKEDLSYLPAQQSRFMQRRTMPADLYPHLYCYLQANLTTDTVEKLQLEGRERIRLARYQTYTEIIRQGVMRLFSEEDGNRFQRKFNRESLLSAFAQGRSWFYDRCQVVDLEGTIQWISVGVNLSADSETGDVCLFAYLSTRNQQQKWEETAAANAMDSDTGLYLPQAAQGMVHCCLQQGGQNLCALAEIWIGGAEELFGAAENNRKKQDVMTALNVFLDTECVVWQKNGESLLAFFPNAASRTILKRRIENAFSYTRISLGGMPEMKFLRFVAGVACANAGDADYERMQHAVAHLCAFHANEAADAVLLSEEEYRFSDVELTELPPEKLASQQLENTRIMTEEDKDVALDCLSLMLSSDNMRRSVDAVLERLGHYYQADRVYILTLTENGQIITMLNEWVDCGKHSIQQSISGKRTSHFPVIARYAKNPAPVVLSMRREQQEGTGEGGEISWQYAMFPMEKSADAEQLLCLENPRRNIERTALLDRMLPYLSRERGRLLAKGEQMSSLDRLYALPNMQDYLDAVYSLDSDRHRSLGALAVDIPGFLQIKEQKGYEYGTRFLLRVSEVLMDVFGHSLLFHTREAEFITLCTDVTYDAFLNLCARAKQLVGRKYAGLFRIGCTWSDGIFRGTDLVNKARSIMNCASPSDLAAVNLREGSERNSFLPEDGPWTGVPENGQFTIYLQPKVDMRTKEVVGAEALLRILDEKGNLLPHGRVIESMEKDGIISRLDYAVFDKVLETLSRWKQKKYPLRSISSNFSRKTLLSPTALASVLAILSRYPEVPMELVELEITETAGSFENNTFSELIERFGGYGLQFSLDDFGSSYSNMSMLADLHFHSVKLDRSMIRNIASNQVSRMMVRDIAQICESRGMTCIAEGVETQAQADALIEDGCFFAQGYYYGRPMPVEEFEKKYFQA